MKKVAVGLSGGVDSAVCVALLKEQGFQPIGVFLKMHQVGNEAAAAEKAAAELDIPFLLKDMTALFKEKVMAPFAEMYLRGETPNPCILCNPAVKFKGLLRAADELGCEKIATGHYASVVPYQGRYLVRRIPGQTKDQSYMLYGLGQEVLSRLLLPLSDEKDKGAVRARANALNLSAASKKDSLDICFLEEGSSRNAFIAALTGRHPQPGEILDLNGNRLGTHHGICGYTVGQRRGLGVASDQRLYVSALDSEKNVVWLGPEASVMKQTVLLEQTVFHLPLPKEGLTAKVRYRDRDTAVQVEILEGNRALLHFENPKKAPAPGQSAVVYWENYVVGGGRIVPMKESQ